MGTGFPKKTRGVEPIAIGSTPLVQGGTGYSNSAEVLGWLSTNCVGRGAVKTFSLWVRVIFQVPFLWRKVLLGRLDRSGEVSSE